MKEYNYTIKHMFKKIIDEILCIFGLHILVRDFLSNRENDNKQALIRQCMRCNKVINKPNWEYKYKGKIK